MSDYETVLAAARQLSAADQYRLIEALWVGFPEDAELPLHPAWYAELDRRLADLRSGKTKSIPWETVRAEALARIRQRGSQQ